MVLATIFISLIARNISKPIHELTSKLNSIRELDLEGDTKVDSRIEEISEITNSIESLRIGLQAFKTYVPARLVKDLIANGETARIGGKNEILTIFFSDIEDFTNISEGLPPEYLGIHLSEYLDEMSRTIKSQSGTIDKYIGDAVMAFWGAPHKDLEHERNACAAAILCLKRLRVLEEKWKAERKPIFRTRIGIHSGPTVVGNMGSQERMNYTVIGDSVNLASRLEGFNKIYGTDIIISGTTAGRVKDHFLRRPLDTVYVKGKSEPIEIIELLDFIDAEDSVQHLAAEHSASYDLYMNMEFSKALQKIDSLLRDFPEDGPLKILQSRCLELEKDPPKESDWSGIRDGLRFRDIK